MSEAVAVAFRSALGSSYAGTVPLWKRGPCLGADEAPAPAPVGPMPAKVPVPPSVEWKRFRIAVWTGWCAGPEGRGREGTSCVASASASRPERLRSRRARLRLRAVRTESAIALNRRLALSARTDHMFPCSLSPPPDAPKADAERCNVWRTDSVIASAAGSERWVPPGGMLVWVNPSARPRRRDARRDPTALWRRSARSSARAA